MKKWLGFLVIPFLSLAYAFQAPLLQENFTGIANKFHQIPFLFGWSILVGVYNYVLSMQLFQRYGWKPGYLQTVAFIAIMLCVLNPLIPYQESRPHLASLHVLFSMLSCVLFLALHLLFLGYLSTVDLDLYQKNQKRLTLIVVTLVLLLFCFGSINSLIECMIVIWMNIYMLRFEI